jgi:6-pyruvoyltetrahydropterin/6-carboxytetrahydropterin synthase
MFQLTIKDHIAAAHFLRGYDGPCKNLHGHTWQIEITIESDHVDQIGIVMDFRLMKNKLKDFLSHLDHVCLNDLPYFKEVNPSTENIAKYVFQKFSKECHPFKLKKVQVWESDSASVTYFE